MFVVVRKSDPSRKKISGNNENIDRASNNLLNTFSLDIFEETDYREKGKASFNRIYEIYDGELHVIIDDQEIILQKGDSIFIGKGTSFEMRGTFKAVAVNTVAF
jgi:mannose-6-phosphate isomerase-like protein (cupin superfamily)